MFLLTGPDYDGEVPEGMEEIECATRITMLAGRLYCSGPDDYAEANALQDACRLTPLSKWEAASWRRGDHYEPPTFVPLRDGIDGDTLVTDQFMALSAGEFYSRLNRLLADNPAYAPDAPLLGRLAKLGHRAPAASLSCRRSRAASKPPSRSATSWVASK